VQAAVYATFCGMRNGILVLLGSVCCFANAGGASLDDNSSVESRLAAQNALFEERYQSDLKAHPERATAYGDYRYNDRLDGPSLAEINSRHAGDQDFLARLDAIPTRGFTEQDVLSHEVLRNTLQQLIEDYGFKEYEMPVSQMDGPHVHLADLPLAVPFDSVKQVGRSTPNSSARKSGFTRIPSATTAGSPVSCFAPCASSSTRESIPWDGPAIRSSPSSASPTRSTSPPFSLRPTDTSPGRRRHFHTSWAQTRGQIDRGQLT
jgi:hypothetical protein